MGWAAITKVGKRAGDFIEIVDTVSDFATLGDEIAKGAMGDDYDPAFRDKCAEVAALGREVDRLVEVVERASIVVDDLSGELDTLDLSLETYQGKQTNVTAVMAKVSEFNGTLGDFRLSRGWLTGPATTIHSHSDASTDREKAARVRAYLEEIGFSGLNVGITSADIGFTAVCHGIRWSLDGSGAPSTGAPARRVRRSAFSGMDMLPDADQRAIKSLRRRRRISVGVDVAAKAVGAVSLGFTIYGIFSRVSTRTAAFAGLDRQVVDYRAEANYYAYCLEGYESAQPDPAVIEAANSVDEVRAKVVALEGTAQSTLDQAERSSVSHAIEAAGRDLTAAKQTLSAALAKNRAFTDAKTFFQTDDPDDLVRTPWTVGDDLGLAFGMKQTVNDLNGMCDELLDNISGLYDDMVDAMDATQNASDEYGQFAAQYITGDDTLDNLKKARDNFTQQARVAGARDTDHAERMTAFEDVRNGFKDSLQKEMSKIIDSASDMLRDLQFAGQMAVYARQVIEDAESFSATRAEDAEARKKLWSLLRMLRPDAADEAVTEEVNDVLGPDDGGEFDLAARAAGYAREQWATSDLDTDPTSRFPDEESARALIMLMVKDLQTESHTPAVDDLVGTYENHLYDGEGKNAWHFVTVSKADDTRLNWTNRAGVVWTLTPTADEAELSVGRECPYYSHGYRTATVHRSRTGQVNRIVGPGDESYDRVG